MAAIAIAALAMGAGCAAHHPDGHPQAHKAPAVANDGTRVITNLDQLSSAPSAVPVDNAQSLFGAPVATRDSAPHSDIAQNRADRNFEQFYLSQQQSVVHGGHTEARGSRTLLNAKARQFPEFSYAMLNQLLAAAQKLESKKLAGRQLPDEIKPMILTALMTPQGRLTDLDIEQHSGVGTVDRIIIDACKKGLWAMNPPRAALASDGRYRMRVEVLVKGYPYDYQGDYRYVTNVGLALR